MTSTAISSDPRMMFRLVANQPRFTKKRIATMITASITAASTIFANVKFSTSFRQFDSVRVFLIRSCSSG
jgi:hypothetical protein